MAEETKAQAANLPHQHPNENEALPSTDNPKKTSWPELIGVSVEEAKKRITEDMPEAYFEVITPDIVAITPDFGFSRVRLFVDESNKVIRTPVVG